MLNKLITSVLCITCLAVGTVTGPHLPEWLPPYESVMPEYDIDIYPDKVARAQVADKVAAVVKATLMVIPDDTGNGSGVFISSQGHALTNYHVAGGRRTIEVVTYNGKRLPAIILASNSTLDLTLIQVLDYTPEHVVPIRKTGIKRGELVVAFGYPAPVKRPQRGIEPDIKMAVTYGTFKKYEALPAKEIAVMHTAYIYFGNSGGPLIDANGELVGLNYQGRINQFTKQVDACYAIPSYRIIHFLNKWIKESTSERR